MGQADGFYLVTGHKIDHSSTCAGVAYYKNFKLGGGNDGTQPDDFVYLGTPGPNGGNWTFEGSSQSVTFPSSGTTLHWSIESNAGNQSVGTNVGDANNGAEQFSVFKDRDFAGLVTNSDGYTLNKKYYAN